MMNNVSAHYFSGKMTNEKMTLGSAFKSLMVIYTSFDLNCHAVTHDFLCYITKHFGFLS